MSHISRKIYYDSEAQTSLWGLPRDLISAREILWRLVWREIKARYRYAVMGFLWAVIEPILFMLLLLFIFTFLIRERNMSSLNNLSTPMATQILCGLIFWQYFSTSLISATYSLVNHQNLVKKLYFPREVIPISCVIYPILNLSIAFIALILIHLILGGKVNLNIFWGSVWLLILILTTTGLGLLFSIGYVHYRDIGNMVNFGLLLGFYASPVFYPLDLVINACRNGNLPPWSLKLYMMNPMVNILEGIRHCVLSGKSIEPHLLTFPLLFSVISLIVGTYVFRKLSSTVSDYM
ncbi:MAG: ABC transporter permease [Candidatus Hydrogenedentes bacterium]|nr:ABC transporter permease [Candidatus Hydrogenedentota bacterium]